MDKKKYIYHRSAETREKVINHCSHGGTRAKRDPVRSGAVGGLGAQKGGTQKRRKRKPPPQKKRKPEGKSRPLGNANYYRYSSSAWSEGEMNKKVLCSVHLEKWKSEVGGITSSFSFSLPPPLFLRPKKPPLSSLFDSLLPLSLAVSERKADKTFPQTRMKIAMENGKERHYD